MRMIGKIPQDTHRHHPSPFLLDHHTHQSFYSLRIKRLEVKVALIVCNSFMVKKRSKRRHVMMIMMKKNGRTEWEECIEWRKRERCWWLCSWEENNSNQRCMPIRHIHDLSWGMFIIKCIMIIIMMIMTMLMIIRRDSEWAIFDDTPHALLIMNSLTHFN